MLTVKDVAVYLPNGDTECYHSGKVPCHNNSIKCRKILISSTMLHVIVQMSKRERREFYGIPFCALVRGKEDPKGKPNTV